MWEVYENNEDPLRQGDLISEVLFPQIKQRLQVVHLEATEGILVPAKRRWGLVVSQCCDSVDGDYVAIAPLRTSGRLTPEQEAALRNNNPDPSDLRGYELLQFRLEPLDMLPALKPTDHHVAVLNRIAIFWGSDCAAFIPLRRARMTVESRRDLRRNLFVLWSRVEDTDHDFLQAAGEPDL